MSFAPNVARRMAKDKPPTLQQFRSSANAMIANGAVPGLRRFSL